MKALIDDIRSVIFNQNYLVCFIIMFSLGAFLGHIIMYVDHKHTELIERRIILDKHNCAMQCEYDKSREQQTRKIDI